MWQGSSCRPEQCHKSCLCRSADGIPDFNLELIIRRKAGQVVHKAGNSHRTSPASFAMTSRLLMFTAGAIDTPRR